MNGETTIETSDPEIVLAHGHLRLRVAPYGASLRGLWRVDDDGKHVGDIVASYEGKAAKQGGQGDVLIPFPGRVKGGTYPFEGATYAMPTNDKDGPNAIHGFLRTAVWSIEEQTEGMARFGVDLGPDDHPGYPFSLRATVAYTLDADGLTVRFTITNTGKGDAPVGAGFHPYFTVGSPFIAPDVLEVPMAATLEFKDLIPTGKIVPVDDTDADFRSARNIADTVLNHCYLAPARDADGMLRIRLSTHDDARSLTVWMDHAFNYVVIYTGESLPEDRRRRTIAIEPMTCGSDALNHPVFGLTVLHPGATLSGAWGVGRIHG